MQAIDARSIHVMFINLLAKSSIVVHYYWKLYWKYNTCKGTAGRVVCYKFLYSYEYAKLGTSIQSYVCM